MDMSAPAHKQSVIIQLLETACSLLTFLSSLAFFFSLKFSLAVFLQETHWRPKHLNIMYEAETQTSVVLYHISAAEHKSFSSNTPKCG